MNLNIIGNGFDLYHGLPSSYNYFGSYLISKDGELYEELSETYGYSFRKMVGPSLGHDYEHVVEKIFWSDFENRLGKLDEYSILGTLPDDLGLEYDYPAEIGMSQSKVFDQINKMFSYWVSDTLDRPENFELILKEMDQITNRQVFNDKDYFLNFNYTHTLQSVYGISDEKIHYVHGECYGDDSSELIIGHGNSNRINEIVDIIDELNEKYDYTQSSQNKIEEYNCLLDLMEKSKKDVERHKWACQRFYSSFDKGIDKIRVYGFSLGEVDMPYLEQIRRNWPDAKWEFSYFSEYDETRIREVAENILGMDKKQYDTFRFCNEISDNIRKEIIKIQCIDEYEMV